MRQFTTCSSVVQGLRKNKLWIGTLHTEDDRNVCSFFEEAAIPRHHRQKLTFYSVNFHLKRLWNFPNFGIIIFGGVYCHYGIKISKWNGKVLWNREFMIHLGREDKRVNKNTEKGENKLALSNLFQWMDITSQFCSFTLEQCRSRGGLNTPLATSSNSGFSNFSIPFNITSLFRPDQTPSRTLDWLRHCVRNLIEYAARRSD